ANLAAQASAGVNKCLLFRALSEERNQLDENVRKRTQELSEAYATLARLDSLKTKFFANVSHELRTPLTLSIGPTELLLRDPAIGAELKGPLESVYKNQVRLLKLINDLLDFSKLEAGQMTTRFAAADVTQMLRSHSAMIEGAAVSRGITLTLDVPDGPVELYLDTPKFEKIFMNLLSNAFKFTPDGGKIDVRLVVSEDEVDIYVTDTGIGIPEDSRDKVFDRFYQVHGSDTRKYAGTGIGLAMVKEFTELHGGRVAVESTVGEGSTFRLTFRRGRTHLSDDAIDHAPTETDAAARRQQLVAFETDNNALEDDVVDVGADASGAASALDTLPGLGVAAATSQEDDATEGATILLVDDTSEMRRFLASVLRPHFRVQMARDGLEALEKLQRFVPDLIISDVMMPRMSGTELSSAVKAMPGALGRTPVILVTAKAEMSMKLDGLSSGADDYLVKPFDVAELMCRAKNLVTVRRQRERLAAAHADLASAHAELKAQEALRHRDLEQARAFQQRLLPELPKAKDLAFYAVYRPLDMVGGDIYDVSAIGP
ncbi:MAG TPA: ATP-binding protein, partial [Labilithrix sp.]|nr:ATP-binding protein [Labilithrix sp.]